MSQFIRVILVTFASYTVIYCFYCIYSAVTSTLSCSIHSFWRSYVLLQIRFLLQFRGFFWIFFFCEYIFCQHSLRQVLVWVSCFFAKPTLKLAQKVSWKVPHTGNTRPSRTFVIQEYGYYTMILIWYHGGCQYRESMSIPWVHVYTMSPCLCHKSMSIPWVIANSVRTNTKSI